MFAIESANIVGYTTTDLNKNCTPTGAAFVSIGENGAKMSQITLQGVSDTAIVGGTINIQILDSLGNAAEKYSYYQNMKAGAYKGLKGWFKADGSQITAENDKIFAPGDGLWVKGLDGAKLLVAGQVVFDDVEKSLNKNCVMLSNPYPMAITLAKNIILSGVSDTAIVGGTINIQILDSLGNAAEKYSYYQNMKAGTYKGIKGWVKADGSQITAENDVTIPAGQGLWVKGLDGAKLTFTLGE